MSIVALLAPVCWRAKLQSISPEQTPKPRPCWMPTVHSSMVTQSVAERVVLGSRFAFGAMFHSMVPPLASRTRIRRSFNRFRSLVYSTVYLSLYVLCDLSDGLFTGQHAHDKQHAKVPSTGWQALYGSVRRPSALGATLHRCPVTVVGIVETLPFRA